MYIDSSTMSSESSTPASIRIEERPDLAELVTFVPNKKIPVHNWFIFKEGFSKYFVLNMLKELGARQGEKILDPFCGVGTTLLTAKEIGFDSVGIDIAPLQVFVTQVKVADYDVEVIKEAAKYIFSERFVRPKLQKFSSLVRRAFSKYALEDIVFLREKIRAIVDPKIKNFFTLALLEAANRVSYAYKDGAVIKIRERPSIPLRKLFKRVVKRMIKDIERVRLTGSSAVVYLADSRDMHFIPNESFDIVITSPPYLNKIEYTKVYSIEYELFFPELKVDGVRSYMGLYPKNIRDPFPNLNLPDVAKAYFQDMEAVLREIHRVTSRNARCAFVIAEGIFPDCVVPADLLFSKLAQQVGFKVDKIMVANRRIVTTEDRVKIGTARESVVIIKK